MMNTLNQANVSGRYILVDDQAVAEPDLLKWAEWLEQADRLLRRTRIAPLLGVFGRCRVSTVFLGLDHNFLPGGPPLLWETMIFGGPLDGEEWRYGSRNEAIAGHGEAVRLARGARNPLRRRPTSARRD